MTEKKWEKWLNEYPPIMPSSFALLIRPRSTSPSNGRKTVKRNSTHKSLARSKNFRGTKSTVDICDTSAYTAIWDMQNVEDADCKANCWYYLSMEHISYRPTHAPRVSGGTLLLYFVLRKSSIHSVAGLLKSFGRIWTRSDMVVKINMATNTA